MLKEFKEFAFKGSLVDMAVGFILGAGFAGVVKSLVTNVIMPPLGALLANIDFSNLKWVIQEGTPAVEAAAGKEAQAAVPEVAITYGVFLQELVSFTILALVVFVVVKKVLAGMKKEEAKPDPAPPPPSAEEALLTEIRDLLKTRS
jgi:large conductance mechanosensitive channel